MRSPLCFRNDNFVFNVFRETVERVTKGCYNGGGEMSCRAKCMDDCILFGDCWCEIVKGELEPIVACRFDEQGCFGTSSKDESLNLS